LVGWLICGNLNLNLTSTRISIGTVTVIVIVNLRLGLQVGFVTGIVFLIPRHAIFRTVIRIPSFIVEA